MATGHLRVAQFSSRTLRVEYQERSSDRSIERAADPGAVARLGRLGSPVRVRGREAVERGRLTAHPPRGPLDVVDVVPPVEPLQQRRLAVEAAVVQREILQQEEADLASRLAAFELLGKEMDSDSTSRSRVLVEKL